jgi:hypothetical protein
MDSRTALQQLACFFEIKADDQTLNDQSLQKRLTHSFSGVRDLIQNTSNNSTSHNANLRKIVLEKIAALDEPQRDHFFQHINDVVTLVVELQARLKRAEPKNVTAHILDIATKNPILFSNLVAYSAGCAELVRITGIQLHALLLLDERLQTSLIQNAATVASLTNIIKEAAPHFDMHALIIGNHNDEKTILARVAFFENAGHFALHAENYRLNTTSKKRVDRPFLDRTRGDDRARIQSKGINPAILAQIAHCQDAKKIESIAANPRSSSSVSLLERLESERKTLKAQRETEASSAAHSAAAPRSRGLGRKS